jgi:hypothetical protein
MQTQANPSLTLASAATLLLALALSAPLVERLLAAGWQWWKFRDTTDDGHVSLGLGSGLVFSLALALNFGAALVLARTARHRSATRALRLSRAAMALAITVLAGYWLLGLGPLNAWRA